MTRGVLLHLIENLGMSTGEVAHPLFPESGLLGVSAIRNDMAMLPPEAREAIDLFCYRAAAELASLAAATGGLDAIVFTAGIGENSALVRELICDRLEWMGVALDKDANEHGANRISSPTSQVEVLIIETDEERVIVRATRAVLREMCLLD